MSVRGVEMRGRENKGNAGVIVQHRGVRRGSQKGIKRASAQGKARAQIPPMPGFTPSATATSSFQTLSPISIPSAL